MVFGEFQHGYLRSECGSAAFVVRSDKRQCRDPNRQSLAAHLSKYLCTWLCEPAWQITHRYWCIDARPKAARSHTADVQTTLSIREQPRSGTYWCPPVGAKSDAPPHGTRLKLSKYDIATLKPAGAQSTSTPHILDGPA